MMLTHLKNFFSSKPAAPVDPSQRFAEIIREGLKGMRAEGGMDIDKENRVPVYLVKMCTALQSAINETRAEPVTLKEILTLDRAATGADYDRKLARRCLLMAQNQKA